MKKSSLLMGAIILFCCNFISRGLGFLYKIILVRIIGSEGIGLSEMVIPVYSFALVVSSLGIPLAMTRLISSLIGRQDFNNTRRIWDISLKLLVISGLIFSLLFYIFADKFIGFFAIDNCVLVCFKIMIPAIFIVTVCSAYRAYFQAIKQIAVIGYSQNIEQFCRVILGIFLAYYFIPFGVETAVAAISVATVCGELLGLLYIVHKFKVYKPQNDLKPTLSKHQIVKYLFTVGTPVTMQRLVMSLVLMLQSFMIPNLLHSSGIATDAATALYGNFSGVAMSLINLPGIFTATLTMAILPAVSETNHRKDILNFRINQSLQLTTFIGIPVSFIFWLFGTQLCEWLFNTPEAGDILKVLAIGAVFIYSNTVLTGILQGMGNVKYLLFSLIFSGLVLIVCLWILVPKLGIVGAAVSSIVFFVLNCLLNLKYIFINCKMDMDIKNILLKPILAVLTALTIKNAANIIFAANIPQNQYLSFVFDFTIIIVSYILVLIVTRGLPMLITKNIRGRNHR